MKTTAVILLSALLAVGCVEKPRPRSAGEPCAKPEECDSNLCFESVCIDPPMSTAPDAEATDASSDAAEAGPSEEAPTDCAALCAHRAACGLLNEGETEAECVLFCEENPVYFPPRLGACAEEFLANGTCDEAAFEDCAMGPVLHFFESAATSVCGRLIACCPDAPVLGSFDDCSGLIVGIAGGFINAAELMGYLVFDTAVADTCAVKLDEAMTGTACESLPAELGPFLSQIVTCDGLMTPLQGEGDPCGIETGDGFMALPDGCMDDLLCEEVPDQMPTCEAGVPVGGECAENTECAGDGRCVDGACALLLAPGAPCTSGQQCESSTCTEETCAEPATMDCLP